MSLRAVALLSGGLDSMLAIRAVQEQGIEVDALNVRTPFSCCQNSATRAAQRLGVRLTVIGEEEEYLDVIRKPRHGRGRGANPCVDCRIFMFRRARHFMQQIGASIVVSGDVLGQRPASQKRRHLYTIAHYSGLEDRLLRPLSAKRLPPTLAEINGDVDRQRLYDFWGRSRKGLIALARQFGFEEDQIPSPSTGCMLTEKTFAPRVFDLIRLNSESTAWDFEVLKLGRHLRLGRSTKAVVGRRQAENTALLYLASRRDSRASAVLQPQNFAGPVTLLIGPVTEEALEIASGLVVRFSNASGQEARWVQVEQAGRTDVREAAHHEVALAAQIL